jgi:hypothetical protein
MELRYNIKNDINTKTHIYFKPTESIHLDYIKDLLEDKYPINKDDNSYENVRDYICRIINNAKFLCKGLNPTYIYDAFNNVDAVVIIGSSMNILPNGNIFGFALINFDEEKNSIYIDVICSHIGISGAGEFLIKTIHDICSKLLMTKIYLTSVKSAISFYEKYGFIKKNPICYDMCLMIKTINKNIGGKTKHNKLENTDTQNEPDNTGYRRRRKTMNKQRKSKKGGKSIRNQRKLKKARK